MGKLWGLSGEYFGEMTYHYKIKLRNEEEILWSHNQQTTVTLLNPFIVLLNDYIY